MSLCKAVNIQSSCEQVNLISLTKIKPELSCVAISNGTSNYKHRWHYVRFQIYKLEVYTLKVWKKKIVEFTNWTHNMTSFRVPSDINFPGFFFNSFWFYICMISLAYTISVSLLPASFKLDSDRANFSGEANAYNKINAVHLLKRRWLVGRCYQLYIFIHIYCNARRT